MLALMIAYAADIKCIRGADLIVDACTLVQFSLLRQLIVRFLFQVLWLHFVVSSIVKVYFPRGLIALFLERCVGTVTPDV